MKERLVMIPGTLCDASLFKYQIEGLKELAYCQVVDHSTSSELGEVAANILSEISGDFSIMGLSYGGIIAFEILRQAPERIKRLILLNTNYKKPSELTRIMQQRFVGMASLGEFREITTHFLKDTMLHPIHAQQVEMRGIVLAMALNTGKEAFIRQIKAQLNRPDSTEDLKKIKCPTLVMTGREDKVCTVELHEEMATLIPNASLKIIETCGHLSTLEQPEVVNQTIWKWWTEHS